MQNPEKRCDIKDGMKIVIVDDHPLFREALTRTVQHEYPGSLVKQLDSISAFESYAQQKAGCDLVLLDLHMPDANGYAGLTRIRNLMPALPILMISAHDDLNVISKLKALGAKGFVSKSSDMQTISLAIQSVIDGKDFFPDFMSDEGSVLAEFTEAQEKISLLTKKQYQVFVQCAQGLLNKQIAYELGITEATVKAHLTTVMRKLGLNNRTQIALFASQCKEELQLNFGEKSNTAV